MILIQIALKKNKDTYSELIKNSHEGTTDQSKKMLGKGLADFDTADRTLLTSHNQINNTLDESKANAKNYAISTSEMLDRRQSSIEGLMDNTKRIYEDAS